MSLTLVLRLLAVGCLIPVALHVSLGVAGDVLIGAGVPEAIDASLDSQNRFYGATFLIYAALLWLCSRDLKRYATVLRLLLAIFFFGGLARGLSALQYGLPATEIIALWTVELVAPPIIWVWHSRHLRDAA